MKKYLTLVCLLMVFAFGLTIFSSCAEKQAVVKDDTLKAAQDAEAARKAKELADREAALRAEAARRDAAFNAMTLQDIYYDYDKSNILPDARETLKINAEIFTRKSSARIVVEGHCDERGTAEYNMALGERRAQEAKRYLVDLGINASRMETISYGEERPLDNRSTEDAWAKNRRAHFLLK